MKSKIILSIFASLAAPAFAATVAIPSGTYTENFNSLVGSSLEPAPGWDGRGDATSSSLGVDVRNFPTALRAWTHTNGGIKNVSSTNIPKTSDATAQNANSNRALGLNQVPTFGNPGLAFNFNFSSTGVLLNSISIDLLLTSNNSLSTVLTIQYGLGSNPTSFQTLATWTDSDVAGGFGSTTFTFDRDDFGSDLDDQSQAWFRVAALDSATGSGNGFDQMAIDNFSVTAVPEPGSMLLGALGFLGLIRRRR